MLEINREVIECPHKRRMWGSDHDVDPKFVEEALGNGDRLLIVTPVNARPNYYVIRVDSGWALDSHAEGEVICDHMDEIYEAIADEYGEEEDSEENLGHEGWPVLDSSSGSCWGELTMEEYRAMESAASDSAIAPTGVTR